MFPNRALTDTVYTEPLLSKIALIGQINVVLKLSRAAEGNNRKILSELLWNGRCVKATQQGSSRYRFWTVNLDSAVLLAALGIVGTVRLFVRRYRSRSVPFVVIVPALAPWATSHAITEPARRTGVLGCRPQRHVRRYGLRPGPQLPGLHAPQLGGSEVEPRRWETIRSLWDLACWCAWLPCYATHSDLFLGSDPRPRKCSRLAA